MARSPRRSALARPSAPLRTAEPAALEARLGLTLTPPTLLAAWHPVTILRDTNAEADALFTALAQTPASSSSSIPTPTPAAMRSSTAPAPSPPRARSTHIFVNLDAITYWSLLGQGTALVGNSSSGIMEAASFALPVVNVGIRQQGRERARNVLDAPAETSAILAAIAQARSLEFRESLRGMANPYGDGNAAATIAHVLATVPLEGLLIKQPAPLQEPSSIQDLSS